MANLGLSLINNSPDVGDDVLSIMTLAGFGLGGGKAVNVSLHTTDEDNEPLTVSAEYEHKLSKNFRWFAAVQNHDDGNDATDDVLKYGAGMRLEF